MTENLKGAGPTKDAEGKVKGPEKGMEKDGDNQLPYWWGSFPPAGVALEEPTSRALPPAPDLKPRTTYPYPAVVDLVDQEQLARELKHRDERAERISKEWDEGTKALKAHNQQQAALLELEKREAASEAKAAGNAKVAEAESAQAAKEADIERHHSEVDRANSRLDYFANREAIECQQGTGDRSPTPDREQGGGWDQER